MESEESTTLAPRSLEELLKWSLKLTDSEMKDWESSSAAMSEERKGWLTEAMADAMKNDEVQLMINSLQVLKDGVSGETAITIEEEAIALEQLVCLCDTIDMAKNFHKLGGFEVMLPLLQSEDSELRWRSAEVVAAAVQNNPFCQMACYKMKGLPILFHLLRTDQVVLVQVKALYALSRLVNNCDITEAEFASLGGFNLLCELLGAAHVKIKIKAAFMLRDQLLKSKSHLEAMLSAGILTNLELQLCLEPDDSLDHFVKLIYVIIAQNTPDRRKELLSDSLRNVLQSKRKWMSMDPTKYEEEIVCIDKLLGGLETLDLEEQ